MFNPFTIIPLDKTAHILAGIAIFLLSVLFFNPIASMVFVVIIAAAKEIIIDAWLNMGDPDKYDILATVLGGVFAAAVYAVSMWLG